MAFGWCLFCSAFRFVVVAVVRSVGSAWLGLAWLDAGRAGRTRSCGSRRTRRSSGASGTGRSPTSRTARWISERCVSWPVGHPVWPYVDYSRADDGHYYAYAVLYVAVAVAPTAMKNRRCPLASLFASPPRVVSLLLNPPFFCAYLYTTQIWRRCTHQISVGSTLFWVVAAGATDKMEGQIPCAKPRPGLIYP